MILSVPIIIIDIALILMITTGIWGTKDCAPSRARRGAARCSDSEAASPETLRTAAVPTEAPP